MRSMQSLFSSFIFLLSVCGTTYAAENKLEMQWQLSSGLMTPESVIYDAKHDVLYVSNINGGGLDKDGNGSISKVSLDGKMLQADWVTGLNGPKGLAIYGGKLYTADIDTLVEIDIEKGQIENRYTVDDAGFLNDVTADNEGNIYVSDMAKDRIHRLHDGKFEIWLEGEALENPNGLNFTEDDIVLGSWGKMTNGFATEVPGHLKRISLTTKQISSVGDGSPVGNLDGVEGNDETGFYVTDWFNGKLFYFTAKGEVTTLLELNQGSADLEYIQDKNLLIIPMMKDNLLNAYKIK